MLNQSSDFTSPVDFTITLRLPYVHGMDERRRNNFFILGNEFAELDEGFIFFSFQWFVGGTFFIQLDKMWERVTTDNNFLK